MHIKKIVRLLAATPLAVGALAFAVPASAASPSFQTNTGQNILFYSDRAGDNELYMQKPGGSVQQLTDNNMQDEMPAWRPDGNAFVFRRYSAGTAAQLYIMTMPNKMVTQLTNNPDFVYSTPMYSPDGTKVVFQTSDASRQSCIGVLTVATGAQTTLVCGDINQRQSVEQPVWSPDGTKIMYTLFSGTIDRYVYNLATGTSTLLLPGAFAGVWSPDMTKIAFSKLPTTAGDHEQTYLCNADGSNVQQITNAGADGTRSTRPAAWYPDGSKLLVLTFAAPDFSPELQSLTLSNLSRQPVGQHVAATEDFAGPGAIN
ncbi:MAG TPA: hypothetical protein VLF40_05510 [Candidatus Saccharimonadales bacterium]|nr:hypothetical protein [Candidatus Saccharimonadales bacterium]